MTISANPPAIAETGCNSCAEGDPSVAGHAARINFLLSRLGQADTDLHRGIAVERGRSIVGELTQSRTPHELALCAGGIASCAVVGKSPASARTSFLRTYHDLIAVQTKPERPANSIRPVAITVMATDPDRSGASGVPEKQAPYGQMPEQQHMQPMRQAPGMKDPGTVTVEYTGIPSCLRNAVTVAENPGQPQEHTQREPHIPPSLNPGIFRGFLSRLHLAH